MSETRERAQALLAKAEGRDARFKVYGRDPAPLVALMSAAPDLIESLIAEAEAAEVAAFDANERAFNIEAARDSLRVEIANVQELLERAESERDARGAILGRLRELVTTADNEDPGWWIGAVEACADAFRERDALRAELEKERAKVRTAALCEMCKTRPGEWVISRHACPDCSGSGAVIVEGET